MRSNKTVPLHLLPELAGLKLDIMRFEIDDLPFSYNEVNIERNDHYVFILCDEGQGKMMVDFQHINFCNSSVYCALPGQISHRIYDQCLTGWYIAIDISLVPNEFKNTFESKKGVQTPYKLNFKTFKQCNALLTIINDRAQENDDGSFYSQVNITLVQSLIGIVAGIYRQQSILAQPNVRPRQITEAFKLLLTENFCRLKKPSDYAKRLNINQNYLNESIKKYTGFPASYWIKNEILTEAKRLLIYTTQNISEIAHTIGYEDAAYFSKVFKTQEGVSPATFRNKKH